MRTRNGGPSLSHKCRILLLAAFSLMVGQGAASFVLRVVGDDPDVAHPLLHLVSGSVGLVLSIRPPLLFQYGIGFGISYLLLGVAGAAGLVDVPRLPLGPVDHFFHISLGATITIVSLVGLGNERPTGPWEGGASKTVPG